MADVARFGHVAGAANLRRGKIGCQCAEIIEAWRVAGAALISG